MVHFRVARTKAQSIVSMLGIKEAPVNVLAIADYLGFKVIPFDFPDTISAVIRIEGDKKVIGVNNKQPEVRRRFSIAHELGHYLSGHEDFTHEKKILPDPEKRYLDQRYRQELEADEFAAELLIPEPLIKIGVLNNRLDTPSLARKYNVSEQAMWIQLINLELASYQSGK